MKTSKLVVLLTIFVMGISTLTKAQSTEEKTEEVNIPVSYGQTQNQPESGISEGTSTYNIVENETQPEAGAADWRSEGETEILRVYSGSHEGNNQVKTIEVRRNPDASGSRSEYVPK